MQKKKLLSEGIDEDGWFVEYYRKLAYKLEIAIGITYLEKKNNSLMNTFNLIDSKGEIILRYSKVHTCSFSKEALLTPGKRFLHGKPEYKRRGSKCRSNDLL